MLSSLREALRGLRQNRLVAGSVLTLVALGSAAVSIAWAVSLNLMRNPMGLQDPDAVVAFRSAFSSLEGGASPRADAVIDYKAQLVGVDRMAAFSRHDGGANLQFGRQVARVVTAEVSPEFFEVLGLSPREGRWLQREDFEKGGRMAAVASESLLRGLSDGPPIDIGGHLTINGREFVVVGIAKDTLRFPQGAQVWLPMMGADATVATGPAIDYLVIGRLRPGLTAVDGQRAFDRFADVISQTMPDEWPTRREVKVVPLADEVMGETVVTIRLLRYALVGGWLIAIVNIAALLSGRVRDRRREFWTRAALGGSRLGLCRPVIAEGALLGAISFGCALIAGAIGVRAVAALFPGTYLSAVPPALNWQMVVVAATLALSTGMAASIPSLWLVLRWPKRVSYVNGGVLTGRQWGTLVPTILQVALTVALLASVAALGLTMRRLAAVDLGFEPTGVEVLNLTVPDSTTESDQARVFGELIRKASQLPGVSAVGATSLLPLSGQDAVALMAGVKGARPIRGSFQDRFALTFVVKGDYLDAIGIRVLSGNGFSSGADGVPREALVNRAFSRRYANPDDLIGRELELPGRAAPPTIVGIIDDVRTLGLQTDVGPQVILEAGQSPGVLTSLVIRHTGREPQLANILREELRTLHPAAVIFDSRDMRSRLDTILEPQRRALIGAASAAALFGFLGFTGLITNLINHVSRTRTSIGVRLALGANRRHIARLVLSRAALLIGVGAALGCALGGVGLKYLVHHQPGLIVPGRMAYVIATCAAVLVGLIAGYPATRAALRIQPSALLRDDSRQ